MPVGVKIENQLSASSPDNDAVVPGTYFIPGLFDRGDVTAPVLVRSMSDVFELLGDRTTYSTAVDDLAAYFGEAGSNGRAYVARVVGPAAARGTVSLSDRAGSPVPTLKADAEDPGADSTRTAVAVRDGIVTGTFDLLVLRDGAQVEEYLNLASPAAAATAAATSNYVRLTSLGSATAAPGNNPAVTASAALSAGSDDRASVTATMLTAALARFGRELGPGMVAVPGQPQANVAAALAAHGRANRRLPAFALPVGTTPAAARLAARGLRTLAGADSAGLFYPHVQVPDGLGGTKLISPEGAVAGRRAATIAAFGTFRAAAGTQGQFQYVLGLERRLGTDDVDGLYDDAVNPLRIAPGGPQLYGWRSLSLDGQFRSLTARDVLNEVAARAEQVLDPITHQTIDGRGLLFREVEADIAAILQPIADAGGLFAGKDDPGYRIDVGPDVNTLQTIQRGEARAVVYLRISPVADLVRIVLVKVPLTNAA